VQKRQKGSGTVERIKQIRSFNITKKPENSHWFVQHSLNHWASKVYLPVIVIKNEQAWKNCKNLIPLNDHSSIKNFSAWFIAFLEEA